MDNVEREIVMNDILYEKTPQKIVKSRHDPSPDQSQLYVNKTAVSSAQDRPMQHNTSRKRSNIRANEQQSHAKTNFSVQSSQNRSTVQSARYSEERMRL